MTETVLKDQQIISYLTFQLNTEIFALNVGNVVNILEMQPLTKVPKSPDYLRGIINLRGEVLPVIDTNNKLGFDLTKTTLNTCILVIDIKVNGAMIKLGILVDSVQEVLEIENKKILPPPSLGNNIETKVISGVVEHGDKFIMVIDIQQLLETKELLNLQNINKNQKNEKS